MSRGFGGVDAVQGFIPDWFAVVVALITQLGDGWFLLALLVGLYWSQRRHRDDVLFVGGLLACGVGLYRGLKYLLRYPRPGEQLLDPGTLPSVVEPIYEAAAHATGYGFPSGHATSATIVYVGLAIVLPVGSRRRRLLVAGGVVTLVALSRVALGVHYLVDVVAGMLLAAGLLVAAFGLIDPTTPRRETTVFAAGVVCNLFYVATSGGHIESLLMLGLSLALLGGWYVLRVRPQ